MQQPMAILGKLFILVFLIMLDVIKHPVMCNLCDLLQEKGPLSIKLISTYFSSIYCFFFKRLKFLTEFSYIIIMCVM